MYKLLVAIFLFMASLSVSAEEVKMQVSGMTCGSCAKSITRAFEADPAVQDVKVDLDKDEVLLVLHKGKSLNQKQATELMKKAGKYKIEDFQ